MWLWFGHLQPRGHEVVMSTSSCKIYAGICVYCCDVWRAPTIPTENLDLLLKSGTCCLRVWSNTRVKPSPVFFSSPLLVISVSPHTINMPVKLSFYPHPFLCFSFNDSLPSTLVYLSSAHSSHLSVYINLFAIGQKGLTKPQIRKHTCKETPELIHVIYIYDFVA